MIDLDKPQSREEEIEHAAEQTNLDCVAKAAFVAGAYWADANAYYDPESERWRERAIEAEELIESLADVLERIGLVVRRGRG